MQSSTVKQPTPSLAPLIERSILFGNPERISPKLSPDGKYLAKYLGGRFTQKGDIPGHSGIIK